MREIFDQQARSLVTDLKTSFERNGIKATGKTIQSLRPEADLLGFKIFADSSIDEVLNGTPPGTLVNENDIQQWIDALGLELKASSVADRIERFGSRLWRGQDPRYPGRTNRQSAVSDVVSPERISEIGKAVGAAFALEIESEIVKAIQ